MLKFSRQTNVKVLIAFFCGNLFSVALICLLLKHGNFVIFRSHDNDQRLDEWANSIQILLNEDQRRRRMFLTNMTTKSSAQDIRDHFYKVVNFPLQTVCKVGKVFGGTWFDGGGCIDGSKFICLDRLYEDVKNGQCLIYSFGIAWDWTFEEAMVSLGCQVRAFDPTISGASKPDTDLISFQRIGLSHQQREKTDIGPVTTLKGAIIQNGDLGKNISYLKVDIEGSELDAIPEWIESGIMERIQQFGIEIHTNTGNLKDGVSLTLVKYLQYFGQLFQLGFRHISTESNECVGKSADSEKRYTSLFEMVFYRPK